MSQNDETPNPHIEAHWRHVGANFLYLTLAQLANPSVGVRMSGIDNDKEDN